MILSFKGFQKFGFQLLAICFVLMQAQNSFAIDVVSLYLAPCQRVTGIILHVDDRSVTLLKIDGELEKIQRYEIIYLAAYPVETVPIHKINDASSIPYLHLRTRQNGELVELIRGWPIDFTADQISFLTIAGDGAVADRNSIWEINKETSAPNLDFKDRKKLAYIFAHPYAFAKCSDGPTSANAFRVYAQQLLSDPVTIKRELDRLQEGHAQIAGYLKREQFYPIPQEYSNDSSLGIWSMAGSRHGSSSHRANNFTPILIDQRSMGPFSYQQIIRTGSAPLPSGEHEETQTQAYFRFKADYLHLSLMGDPTKLLVGTNYKWSLGDFKQSVADGVVNEGQVEIGFDYKSFELNLYALDLVETGMREGPILVRASVPLAKVGLTWQTYRVRTDIQYGISRNAWDQDGMVEGEQFRLSIARWNFRYLFNQRVEALVSILDRTLADANKGYSSKSYAGSVTGTYKFSKKYSGSALLATEIVKTDFTLNGVSQSQSKIFPKGGINFTLTF